MSSTRTVRPQAVAAEIPPVPLTVEGYSVLHQMMRFRWDAWRSLRAAQKSEIVREATSVLSKMEQNSTGQSALFSLLGLTSALSARGQKGVTFGRYTISCGTRWRTPHSSS